MPSIGAELAVARREEIGLARLRGIHGLRLWRFLLLEPLLAIVLGALVGLAVGAVGTVLATSTWLDEAADPAGRPALLATAAIAGVGLVIVGLSAAAALRERARHPRGQQHQQHHAGGPHGLAFFACRSRSALVLSARSVSSFSILVS